MVRIVRLLYQRKRVPSQAFLNLNHLGELKIQSTKQRELTQLDRRYAWNKGHNTDLNPASEESPGLSEESVQELCERRGGRPVPDSLYSLWTYNYHHWTWTKMASELRSCVKVEVAVLPPPSDRDSDFIYNFHARFGFMLLFVHRDPKDCSGSLWM